MRGKPALRSVLMTKLEVLKRSGLLLAVTTKFSYTISTLWSQTLAAVYNKSSIDFTPGNQ